MKLILLFIFSLHLHCGNTITDERIFFLKESCKAELFKNTRNIPLAVRLIFHDCVGEGGCNGCVDLNNPENAGLGEILALVTQYYKGELSLIPGSNALTGPYALMVTEEDREVVEGLSLADWIALAAIAAAEMGIESGGYKGSAKFTFKKGRTTKATCSGDNDRNFPDAHHGFKETFAFLMNEFGLTKYEAVALLGAHSLGQMAHGNSGFNGPWTPNQEHLNSVYFKQLVTFKWKQNNINNQLTTTDVARYQWRSIENNVTENKEPAMVMLNADMSIYRDITVDSEGAANCSTNVETCPLSPTANYVEEFAEDNDKFVEEFIVVFTKMMEKGLVEKGPASSTASRLDFNFSHFICASMILIMCVC